MQLYEIIFTTFCEYIKLYDNKHPIWPFKEGITPSFIIPENLVLWVRPEIAGNAVKWANKSFAL